MLGAPREFRKGDVASNGEATDASIAVVPRIGMRLSYLRLPHRGARMALKS
jgi:hypothetical protein